VEAADPLGSDVCSCCSCWVSLLDHFALGPAVPAQPAARLRCFCSAVCVGCKCAGIVVAKQLVCDNTHPLAPTIYLADAVLASRCCVLITDIDDLPCICQKPLNNIKLNQGGLVRAQKAVTLQQQPFINTHLDPHALSWQCHRPAP
jgi:hypothetical protein